MTPASNIKAFLTAAASHDALIQSYCGLVALELVIKREIGLKDHDVCAGLNRYRLQKATGSHSAHAPTLLSLTTQLQNGICAIKVNNKESHPISAPANCYPFIRYTRYDIDGWPAPHTTVAELKTLASIVQQILSLLRRTFGLHI